LPVVQHKGCKLRLKLVEEDSEEEEEEEGDRDTPLTHWHILSHSLFLQAIAGVL